MSAVHSMESAEGADSPVVFVLLGIESLARRVEEACRAPAESGFPEAETADQGPPADAPGLLLLGGMSLLRRWRALRGAMRRGDDTGPTPRERRTPALSVRSLLT